MGKEVKSQSGLYIPKGRHKWVCLWKDEHGKIIVNENRDYLCAESWTPNNNLVELKMRQAAEMYGIEGGQPFWVPGRQITQTEWETQMERLMEGKEPDENPEYW